jgi:superfamily II DNA or RNA helicase
LAAILALKFPFELKKDQKDAIEAWLRNDCHGSVIFSTGTGKTEIALECARQCALRRLNVGRPKQDHLTEVQRYNQMYKGIDDRLPPAARADLSPNTEKEDKDVANKNEGTFKILFLVPRIVLITQNIRRLLKYRISEKAIGVYYGERKDVREITISTYQSIINRPELLREANMVILDEIHLISETAVQFEKIFDVIIEDPSRAILGLTATIDEKDPKYHTIMVVAPPIKKYMIKDAVADGRVAQPEIIPIKANFTIDEQRVYDETTLKIKEISYKLNAFDPIKISAILKSRSGGYRASLARDWFVNVQKRKRLLSGTNSKLNEAVKIVKEHDKERIMIFSETISSIDKLKQLLDRNGIASRTIHNSINSKKRNEILQSWGKEYFPLLSVHTLEIGYDIPDVGIAIIIASTANISQISQRIGRVIRKTEQKNIALIYIIYVSDTSEGNILKMAKSAIYKSGGDSNIGVQRELIFGE